MAKKKEEDMKVSNFNMLKLDSEKLETHLRSSIQMGSNCALFGRRGTGKTEITKQVIKETGCKEVYINLSVLERVDLGGYPDIMASSRKEEFVNFILPKFYESMINGDEEVVALLDEVDKASPDLWAPLLEFVQFKSINGRKLKNLKSVIMTGNLIAEGGSRPSLPLLDRAEKYLIEPSVEKWMKWAGRAGNIHPSVTAYINDHSNELFGAVADDDRYADPSPRGWANASRLIVEAEKFNASLNEKDSSSHGRAISTEQMVEKVMGSVGHQAGLELKVYFQYYMDLIPMVDKLMAGKDISAEHDKLGLSHKLVVGMVACSRAANKFDELETAGKALKTGDKLPAWATNIGKFIEKMDIENSLALRSQIGHDRFMKHNLCDAPHWGDQLNKLNDTMRSK